MKLTRPAYERASRADPAASTPASAAGSVAPVTSAVPGPDAPVLRLEAWTGPVADDDPDARFKEEIADYGRLDPTATLDGLADYLGVPPGALARAILARWASEGSTGLLELGPSMVTRLVGMVREAEADGTDEARLAAFHRLAGMLSWLAVPVEQDADLR